MKTFIRKGSQLISRGFSFPKNTFVEELIVLHSKLASNYRKENRIRWGNWLHNLQGWYTMKTEDSLFEKKVTNIPLKILKCKAFSFPHGLSFNLPKLFCLLFNVTSRKENFALPAWIFLYVFQYQPYLKM